MPPILTWEEALRRSAVLDLLAEFHPQVVGTLPLDLAVEGSDIDIVCQIRDADSFSALLWLHFGSKPDFTLYQWLAQPQPVIASFIHDSWPIEIFGSSEPVERQSGWRHFAVERRLLALAPSSFHDAIMRHRHAGMKTEPAFAKVLGLAGDPHKAMLELADKSEPVLQALLDAFT
jgi:hypothetical protein